MVIQHFNVLDLISLCSGRMLLQRKDLDLDEKDQDGRTAEDFATDAANHEVVGLIREERAKRMGGVWTKPETVMLEDDPEDESEEEEVEDVENSKLNVSGCIAKEDEEDAPEDDFLKSQLISNLNERIQKEKTEMEGREGRYQASLATLREEFLAAKLLIEQELQVG